MSANNLPDDPAIKDLNQQLYADRRARLMKETGADIIIIPGAAAKVRNNDNVYPFRQDSNFYYLTGFVEPNAIAVLIPNRKEGEFILFCQPHDPLMETFTGVRAGQEGAIKKFGANQSFEFKEFDKELPKLLEKRNKIQYLLGADSDFDSKFMKLLGDKCRTINYGREEPLSISDVRYAIQKMRTIKVSVELENIREAVRISELAHLKAMQTCKPDMSENKLSRKIIDVFMDNGLNTPDVAYPNIVGSGKNGCTLHYEQNNSNIKEGDLVLIDAGCEYKNYASDITRTFPANGKFSEEQRQIYDLVLKTQEACIKAIKPGVSVLDIHKLSEKIITQGLIELGILHGDLNELLDKRAFAPFYMHGVGHEMGLDVHDSGMARRGFEPNMVVTVEPGIYIPDSIPNVDPKWHNIGVRIEDDILVTEQGCEVISKELPKKPEEIEAVMAGNVPDDMVKIGYKDKAADKHGQKFKIFTPMSVSPRHDSIAQAAELALKDEAEQTTPLISSALCF